MIAPFYADLKINKLNNSNCEVGFLREFRNFYFCYYESVLYTNPFSSSNPLCRVHSLTLGNLSSFKYVQYH